MRDSSVRPVGIEIDGRALREARALQPLKVLTSNSSESEHSISAICETFHSGDDAENSWK